MAVVTRNCIVSFLRAIFSFSDQPNVVSTVTELLIFVIYKTCFSLTKQLTLRDWREIILGGTKNSEDRSSTLMVHRTPCVGFQIMVSSLR
jgi:hypothetical protein